MTRARKDRWLSTSLALATFAGSTALVVASEAGTDPGQSAVQADGPAPDGQRSQTKDDAYRARLDEEARQLREYRRDLAEAARKLKAEVATLKRGQAKGKEGGARALPAAAPLAARVPDVPAPEVPVTVVQTEPAGQGWGGQADAASRPSG